MTKQHFIAIADAIRDYNACPHQQQYNESQLAHLADTFKQLNPRFNRERWLAYIAGKCGPNGGGLDAAKPYSRVRKLPKCCEHCNGPMTDYSPRFCSQPCEAAAFEQIEIYP